MKTMNKRSKITIRLSMNLDGSLLGSSMLVTLVAAKMKPRSGSMRTEVKLVMKVMLVIYLIRNV